MRPYFIATIGLVAALASSSALADIASANHAVPGNLVVAKGSCMQPKSALTCEVVLKLLQTGDFQLAAFSKTILSRNAPEFLKMFQNCQLAPSAYKTDMDLDAQKSDPFYYDIRSGSGVDEHVEGQFLAYGPFDIFDVSIGSGHTIRVISARGFQGWGAEYPLQEFYVQTPQSPCRPFGVGSQGQYYEQDEKRLHSWGAVITLKGSPYIATYDDWGFPSGAGAIDLTPINGSMNANAAFGNGTHFSTVGPNDK